MELAYREVADMIFERGALKFGAFKLKLHDKNPDAPLSPFYLNLRTKDNPTNPGPLVDADCDLIAAALMRLAKESNLQFEAIAGIPYAGDPIIAAIERLYPEPRYFRIIKLAKKIMADQRRIIPLEGFDYVPAEEVLIIDDLITKADSKLEAITSVESAGSSVKNLAVLVDREQGGRSELGKAGYVLHACFTIRSLFNYYLLSGKINPETYKKCTLYLAKNS